jgi:hypothetical protein
MCSDDAVHRPKEGFAGLHSPVEEPTPRRLLFDWPRGD